MYGLLADLVVLVHFLFVVLVGLGGLLVLCSRKFLWLHLPVLAWGLAIEFIGFICPLTPLENWLRMKHGAMGYEGGFLEHYLLPILYPEGLNREIQIGIGVLVLILNAAIYGYVLTRRRDGTNARVGTDRL
ncbi:MAG: DUF2784 domain-containing protein [Gammaproteobacteria bacterium]